MKRKRERTPIGTKRKRERTPSKTPTSVSLAATRPVKSKIRETKFEPDDEEIKFAKDPEQNARVKSLVPAAVQRLRSTGTRHAIIECTVGGAMAVCVCGNWIRAVRVRGGEPCRNCLTHWSFEYMTQTFLERDITT